MENERLERQVRFAVEVDRLKGVMRRTILIDGSRNENSAEHSWHVALMAYLLAEHSDVRVDVGRVMVMLLVHDVVEVDAGDTYCYDAASNVGKEERERAAAERVFGLLPEDQGRKLKELWEEFEAGATAEARLANAMDRLQPMLNNFHTKGVTWREHGVTEGKVRKRMEPIGEASGKMGRYVTALIGRAVELGYLGPG